MSSKVFGTTKTALSSKREIDLTDDKVMATTTRTIRKRPVNSSIQTLSDTRDYYSKQHSLLNKEKAELDRNTTQNVSVLQAALHQSRLLNNEQVVAKTTTQGTSKMTINRKDTLTGIKGIDAETLNECEEYGIKPVITTQEFTNLNDYNRSLLNTEQVVETETTTQTASKAVKDTTQMTSKTERIATEILNLRIDKGLSWKKCRAILELSNNEFHKGIRLTDVYRETAIEILNTRIADGWETKRSLSILTGVDGIEDMLNTDEVVETETTTLEDSTYVEVLNTDEVVDDGYDELSDWEREQLNEWKAMRDLNDDTLNEDEVVETETTTQTESEVVETTTHKLGFFGKLNAIVAILKQ